MWGIIPAAGAGRRIQPLAFSKELLPVGSRSEGGAEYPRAVAEYLVERMARGGVGRICFVISPGKSDILEYFGGGYDGIEFFYAVQPRPVGLCDAIFRALSLVAGPGPVVIGLPDTIWFPKDALLELDDGLFSLLLFPVERPQLFDAVTLDEGGRVIEVEVKADAPGSRWVWGALKLPGTVLTDLHRLWLERGRQDEYLGTLINAYIARGGEIWGREIGRAYVDVGTVHGYREAMSLLTERPARVG